MMELGTCAAYSCPSRTVSPAEKRIRVALFDVSLFPTKVTHFCGLALETYSQRRGRTSCSSRASRLGPLRCESDGDRKMTLGSNTHRFSRSLPNELAAGLLTLKHKRRDCLRLTPVRSAAGTDVDVTGGEIADDYYSVLCVPHDATPEEIKKAYYSCMKVCHPDLAGEDAETTSFCMFVNEIYEILIDPVQRMVYDEINGYSLVSTNPFKDMSKPKDHVFVDEFTCIGCKNCANTAPKTFEIEEDFGRARAVFQCGKVSVIQQAIDTCPVDCIHWVSAAELSLLEDEMRKMERVNVGVMLSGMGSQSADVFAMASARWEKRQARAVERSKIKMMMEKNKNMSGPWWQNLWKEAPGEGDPQAPGGTKTRTPVDEEVQQRAAKAAAAARRWREYSRKGVDRRPIYDLPTNCMSEGKNEDKIQSPEMAKQ